MMHYFGIPIREVSRIVLSKDWHNLKTILESELADCEQNNTTIPLVLVKLLITAEDHRFFGHNGVDIIAIVRAIWRRIRGGRWEGASTIEMQLTRVLTQNYEFSFRRKIKEIMLASLITSVVPKRLVPLIYLRRAYFGWKMNGIEQALARINAEPENLSILQCAEIISRIKYPEPKRYSRIREEKILKRAKHILSLYENYNSQGLFIGLEV